MVTSHTMLVLFSIHIPSHIHGNSYIKDKTYMESFSYLDTNIQKTSVLYSMYCLLPSKRHWIPINNFSSTSLQELVLFRHMIMCTYTVAFLVT